MSSITSQTTSILYLLVKRSATSIIFSQQIIDGKLLLVLI